MKNKRSIILLIILLVLCCCCLLSFMFFALRGKFRFSGFSLYQTVSNQLVVDEVYPDDFEKVDVLIGSGDVFIRESVDDQVHVRIYSDRSDVQVTTVNRKLQVSIPEKDCSFFCFERRISKVEIDLPKEYSKDIQISNLYGDIEIGEFLSARIVIEEKYGDVSVLGGDVVTIQNEFGDIRLEKARDAKIRESAGEVNIGTVFDVTVTNNYGDIRIQKVENYLDIKEDCGDVEIGEVFLKKDSSIKNSYGNIEVGFTNEIFIQGKTDLGDVHINQNYPKADVVLNLKNSCGDIEVDN
ncbi:MAG: DUF4097 domain-containing protein [Bacilli bacterium]|nr:DUF4097 domain-containing protein [Bacilli bacterium]